VSLETHRPVTDRGRLTAEHVAALALSESATLAEAAVGVLRAMCEALGWDYGALWNADARSGFLHCVNTWHLPTVHVPEFEAITRRTTFTRGVGLPGASGPMARPPGFPTWWPTRTSRARPWPGAKGCMVHSRCLSWVQGHVAGVMEFFSRESASPTRICCGC
jgi:hypothetical protein